MVIPLQKALHGHHHRVTARISSLLEGPAYLPCLCHGHSRNIKIALSCKHHVCIDCALCWGVLCLGF